MRAAIRICARITVASFRTAIVLGPAFFDVSPPRYVVGYCMNFDGRDEIDRVLAKPIPI
jgi:hypothetical protein